MSETFTEQLERLREMGDEKWGRSVISQNDRAAIAAVLAQINTLAIQNEAQRVALTYARVDGARELAARVNATMTGSTLAATVQERLGRCLTELEGEA